MSGLSKFLDVYKELKFLVVGFAILYLFITLKSCSLFDQKVTLTERAVTAEAAIEQLAKTNSSLTKDIDMLIDIGEIRVDAIDRKDKQEKVIQVTKEKIVKDLDVKIDKITKDPSISIKDKELEILASEYDSLLSSFCTVNNTEPQCTS